MRFTVTDPGTGENLQLEAIPEVYNGENGYRIFFEDKSSIIIGYTDNWKVLDSHLIQPELVEIIGLAIREREQQQ
jgi:hypothetical protein